LTHKKASIRTFVKEIKVTGNDAVLTYTAPLPPQGLTEEKLRVLSSVQYGGAVWTVSELVFESKRLILKLQQLFMTAPVLRKEIS